MPGAPVRCYATRRSRGAPLRIVRNAWCMAGFAILMRVAIRARGRRRGAAEGGHRQPARRAHADSPALRSWRTGRRSPGRRGTAAGDLTPRGAQLATLMGRYYRQYLGEQAVVMAAGCPARDSVYVYADTHATDESDRAGAARRIRGRLRHHLPHARPTADRQPVPSARGGRLQARPDDRADARAGAHGGRPQPDARATSRRRSIRCRRCSTAASPRCARRSAAASAARSPIFPRRCRRTPTARALDLLGALAIASTTSEIAAARIRGRQAGGRRRLGPRDAARRCCRRGGCTPKPTT